jgi:hypothetical protein
MHSYFYYIFIFISNLLLFVCITHCRLGFFAVLYIFFYTIVLEILDSVLSVIATTKYYYYYYYYISQKERERTREKKMFENRDMCLFGNLFTIIDRRVMCVSLAILLLFSSLENIIAPPIFA